MTISEAMHRAVTLPGCRGFCFHGELTEGVIDVWFKNKCPVLCASVRTGGHPSNSCMIILYLIPLVQAS